MLVVTIRVDKGATWPIWLTQWRHHRAVGTLKTLVTVRRGCHKSLLAIMVTMVRQSSLIMTGNWNSRWLMPRISLTVLLHSVEGEVPPEPLMLINIFARPLFLMLQNRRRNGLLRLCLGIGQSLWLTRMFCC